MALQYGYLGFDVRLSRICTEPDELLCARLNAYVKQDIFMHQNLPNSDHLRLVAEIFLKFYLIFFYYELNS